ncbi:MAG: NUDIX hydrolase [Pseudomonadota bacterium]|nr:NUDIX hydrolase [Pseudomonadota bacterium]
MKFCSQCGSKNIEYSVPLGDNRQRYHCLDCNSVFYENPKIVAGCIPVWKDKILMCKRGIEPRYGLWTLPAGFMENGESTKEAAERETMEEAGTKVKDSRLYALFNLPQINQVYMMFLSNLYEPAFKAGEESLDCKLCLESEIPWDQIAFPTITYSLKLFFKDRSNGRFFLHTADLKREKSSSKLINLASYSY